MRPTAIVTATAAVLAVALGIVGIAIFASGNRDKAERAQEQAERNARRIGTVCDAVKEFNARDRILIASGAKRFKPPLSDVRIALALRQIPEDCVTGDLPRLLRILSPGAITEKGDAPRRGQRQGLLDGNGHLADPPTRRRAPRAAPRSPRSTSPRAPAPGPGQAPAPGPPAPAPAPRGPAGPSPAPGPPPEPRGPLGPVCDPLPLVGRLC